MRILISSWYFNKMYHNSHIFFNYILTAVVSNLFDKLTLLDKGENKHVSKTCSKFEVILKQLP